jgi:hypothetical protein
MSCGTPLEARIARKTSRAIVDCSLIEDGDRVMVGLSGGKCSWAVLQILGELSRRAPIVFSLVSVNVDSGYKDYKHDVIVATCRERVWEYKIEHTSIGEVINGVLEDNATPCSLAPGCGGSPVSDRGRGGCGQDRAGPPPRRFHRTAATQYLLFGVVQGNAGEALLRQRRKRGHPAAGVRGGVKGRDLRENRSACPSAAAVQPVAI